MSNTTANTAELTQAQVARILVQPLEEASQFLSQPVRIFDTTGPLRIPKMGGPTDVEWVGESELISDADVDMDEVSLLPSTLRSLKTLTRYSNELARSSVVALDAALQSRLVTDVAAKLDGQMFGAGGDGVTTPRGLFAHPGTQSLPVNGAVEFDDLLDAWGMALEANVSTAGLRWVMRSREFIKLRKAKDGDGRYLMQPDPTLDSVMRMFGAPVIVSNRVPDATGQTPTARMALVDFSQLAVARDLSPSVTVLRERFADYDEQALRVVCRYDAAPLNAEGIIKLTGIAA